MTTWTQDVVPEGHNTFVDPLLSGIVAALVGGVVGAAISAGASLRLARGATREKARAALWDYQRTLLGFANHGYSDAGYGEGQAYFASTDSFKAVAESYANAYQWSGYMPRPVRDKLFRNAFLEIGDPPYDEHEIAANSAWKLALELEYQLDRRFPLHWRDRFRRRKPPTD